MREVLTQMVDAPGADFIAEPSGKAGSITIAWTYSPLDIPDQLAQTLYVFMVCVWLGVSKDNFGDVSFNIYNATRGVEWLPDNDDHYMNRATLNGNTIWIGPLGDDKAFFVAPGDTVKLVLTVNADANTPLVSQSFAVLYYTLQ